jgi:hypothetical protein
MATGSPLSVFWSLLFLFIACFYLFRLVSVRPWINHVDAENEVGHGMMAIGMMVMLAPAGSLTSDLIRWNIILFALASLWWTIRLFARRPLLAILLRIHGGHSPFRSDAIHVCMHVSMCYLFLLMSSMALSMTRPATYATSLFFVVFDFLTLFYGREVAKDFQAAKMNWLHCGANLAHVLMSAMMGWMSLEMLSMTMSMGIR